MEKQAALIIRLSANDGDFCFVMSSAESGMF